MIRNNPILEKDLEYIINSPLPWETLEGKTFLFVGINSFLLAYMVKTLLFLNQRMFKKPVKIKGIYRSSARLKEQYGENLNDLTLYKINDTNPSFFTEIDHTDIIVHGASPASPIDFMQAPLEVVDLNIFLTRHLLEHALNCASENFIYVSSSEIYGTHYPNHQLKENDGGSIDPLNLRSCYGESKRAGEMLCSIYYHSAQVPTKVIRPFHTYGPGMRLRDGRIFSDLVADILEKKPLTLKSSGKAIRSFCYLADAALAYFTVLFKGKNAEAYNVGNPNGMASMYDLANMLTQIFPSSSFQVNGDQKEESICIPNIEKIQMLGWNPSIDLKEGFLRTVKSYEYY